MLKLYRDGFIGLGLVILLLALTVFCINKYFKDTDISLRGLRESGKIRATELKIAEDKRTNNEEKLKILNPFIDAWNPFLKQTQEAPKVLNDIVSFSFKNTIAVAEKSVQVSRVTHLEGINSSILISLKVIGKFERIYYWLGEIESKYPHAMISELTLRSENRNATVKLSLELPLLQS